MVIVNGQFIYQWGDVSKKYITHATCKNFLSALYGKYVIDGAIDLNKDPAQDDPGRQGGLSYSLRR